MTPLERATKILRDSNRLLWFGTNDEFTEMVRAAIVEATNEETERRQRIVAEMAEQVRLQSDRIVALEGEIARLRAARRSGQ